MFKPKVAVICLITSLFSVSCPAATLRTNKDNNLKTVLSQVYKFRHTLLGDQADSNETCSK